MFNLFIKIIEPKFSFLLLIEKAAPAISAEFFLVILAVLERCYHISYTNESRPIDLVFSLQIDPNFKLSGISHKYSCRLSDFEGLYEIALNQNIQIVMNIIILLIEIDRISMSHRTYQR